MDPSPQVILQRSRHRYIHRAPSLLHRGFCFLYITPHAQAFSFAVAESHDESADERYPLPADMKDVILPNRGKGVVVFDKALGRTSKQDIDEGNVLDLDPYGLESRFVGDCKYSAFNYRYNQFTAVLLLTNEFVLRFFFA